MKPFRWFLIVGVIITTLIYGLLQWWDWKGRKRLLGLPKIPFPLVPLKTGDILLFSHCGFSHGWCPNSSLIVKVTSFSPISHIGMVWLHPTEGRPYIWEMCEIGPGEKTYLPKQKPANRKTNQLVLLEERLRHHDGPVLLRSLNRPVETDRMTRYIKAHISQIYNLDIVVRYYQRQLGHIPMDFLRDPPNHQTTICSELIVDTYMELGVLERGRRPTGDYLPKDFHSPTESLLFIGGYSLNPEICLIHQSHQTVP